MFASVTGIEWKGLIVDEAQRLKSMQSKLLTTLINFKTDHRAIMSGTPLQNNTAVCFLFSLHLFYDS